MRPVARRWLALLGMALVCAGPASVRAECESPPMEPQAVTPSVGASGVTLDAWVMARFSEGYFGPEGPGDDPATLITVESCGACGAVCAVGDGTPVSGDVQVFADDLFFLPSTQLEPDTQYVGIVDGLEGSIEFEFCTGDSLDTRPPTLGNGPSVDPVEVGASCELPDGGYRVGVYADAASDDGPPGSVEYLLFLTRGPELTAPRLVDRVRNNAGENTLRVLLEHADGATQVCVRIAAVDGVGRVTVDDHEECFDPVTKVRFETCSVAPTSHEPAWLATASLVAGLAALWRRRAR